MDGEETITLNPDYGAFNDSLVEVNEETGFVKASVRLQHGVTLSVEAPFPVACAWLMDNPAGRLLGAASKLKV